MPVFIRSQADVGTTYKRALTRKIPVRDRSVSFCLTVPKAIGRCHCYDCSATSREIGRESRDEALRLLAETSFSIPLPEPDVQVSKHPALYAWALVRLWVGLRYV